MNKFRNEKLITLGESDILLRPTFNNLAKLENEFGSIPSFAVKISTSKDGSDSQLSLTTISKFFFLNQAEENLSLEEIFQLVIEEGYQSCKLQMLHYFILLTAGKKQSDKMQKEALEKQALAEALEKKV